MRRTRDDRACQPNHPAWRRVARGRSLVRRTWGSTVYELLQPVLEESDEHLVGALYGLPEVHSGRTNACERRARICFRLFNLQAHDRHPGIRSTLPALTLSLAAKLALTLGGSSEKRPRLGRTDDLASPAGCKDECEPRYKNTWRNAKWRVLIFRLPAYVEKVPAGCDGVDSR